MTKEQYQEMIRLKSIINGTYGIAQNPSEDELNKMCRKYMKLRDLYRECKEAIMEFDNSRVYTTLNADELKLGSTIIPADNLNELKCRVKNELFHFRLTEIRNESSSFRFVTDNGNSWELAYLVSEPEEKKLRWTDLKIGDIITQGNLKFMVTAIDSEGNDKCHIYAGDVWLDDNELKDWKKVEK